MRARVSILCKVKTFNERCEIWNPMVFCTHFTQCFHSLSLERKRTLVWNWLKWINRDMFQTINKILFTIWCHLYYLKNLKNTHGRVVFLVKLRALASNFTNSNTPPWVFSRFFNCTKGTIAQCIILSSKTPSYVDKSFGKVMKVQSLVYAQPMIYPHHKNLGRHGQNLNW